MKHSCVGGAYWVFVSEKQHKERYSGYDTPSSDPIPPSLFSFFLFWHGETSKEHYLLLRAWRISTLTETDKAFVLTLLCISVFLTARSGLLALSLLLLFLFQIHLQLKNSALHSSPLSCNKPKPLWLSLCDTCFSQHFPTNKHFPWPDGSSLRLCSLVSWPLNIFHPYSVSSESSR